MHKWIVGPYLGLKITIAILATSSNQLNYGGIMNFNHYQTMLKYTLKFERSWSYLELCIGELVEF